MAFIHFINQPFPSPAGGWKMNILKISIVVSVFLLVFQPLDYQIPYKQAILTGYGVVSFFTGALLHIICIRLFPKLFQEDTWTIKKHLLWFFVQIFFIGITNHYYSVCFLPKHPNNIEGIMLFELRAVGLGIFLITIQIVVMYNMLLARNLKEAAEINKKIKRSNGQLSLSDDEICLSSENDKEFIRFRISDLYFIESEGNYIKVYYTQNNIPKRPLLRSSLKKAEAVLEKFPDVIKCHRCYLVNIRNVCYLKGSSVGYRIPMEAWNTEIPVARNYAKTVK